MCGSLATVSPLCPRSAGLEGDFGAWRRQFWCAVEGGGTIGRSVAPSVQPTSRRRTTANSGDSALNGEARRMDGKPTKSGCCKSSASKKEACDCEGKKKKEKKNAKEEQKGDENNEEPADVCLLSAR